jgi:L-2-hydroxyglutarate oxidase
VVQSIRVPQTGIIDYAVLSRKLQELIIRKDGTVLLSTKVTGLKHQEGAWQITTTRGELLARRVVNCTGLYSDEVTRLSQPTFKEQIIPFRGEYYELEPEAHKLVNHLIYPVPDPAFPFLGVHFTRMIQGGIEAGPSAVLALRREGYTNKDIHWGELMQMLRYPGFRKLIAKHWQMGLGEMYRSFSKAAFVKSLQKLVPEIKAHHLTPAPSGVRAMAVGLDGKMLDDYLFIDQPGMVHACNTPSPAATSGLSIGKTLAEKVMSVSM